MTNKIYLQVCENKDGFKQKDLLKVEKTVDFIKWQYKYWKSRLKINGTEFSHRPMMSRVCSIFYWSQSKLKPTLLYIRFKHKVFLNLMENRNKLERILNLFWFSKYNIKKYKYYVQKSNYFKYIIMIWHYYLLCI